MPSPKPLPPECLAAPWRARDLPAVERSTRRRDDVVRPYRGVRVATELDVASPTVRALAAAAAWPGVPLGGWAAAHLLGAADMDGKDRSGRLHPVMVCPGRSGRIARRPGVAPLRSELAAADVVAVGAVTVTAPVRTAFDLARTAPGLWQAVEEVDCVVRGRDPQLLTALSDYAAARPRWKGVAQARRAAQLATVSARSRGESWLRMVWVQAAGLPPPRVNAPVRDTHDHLVGVPDLLDEGSGLVGEYDGGGHRTARQQHADAVRDQLMAVAGLTVVRATALDRPSPRAMARRLRTGHALACRTPRGAWWVPS